MGGAGEVHSRLACCLSSTMVYCAEAGCAAGSLLVVVCYIHPCLLSEWLGAATAAPGVQAKVPLVRPSRWATASPHNPHSLATKQL